MVPRQVKKLFQTMDFSGDGAINLEEPRVRPRVPHGCRPRAESWWVNFFEEFMEDLPSGKFNPLVSWDLW